MITLIDYGLGNIQAFASIYKSLGISCSIASHPRDLVNSTRLILPGVGSFDWAVKQLRSSGFCSILNELVLERKVPILGVCVGMQIMAFSSDEGELPGLGWIPGNVKRFEQTSFSSQMYLPHMGWNNISHQTHPLFDDIYDPRFYFLHSYYYSPSSSQSILAFADYGCSFPAAVFNGHIIGVQFHPEKSHKWGIQLLKNFALSSF